MDRKDGGGYFQPRHGTRHRNPGLQILGLGLVGRSNRQQGTGSATTWWLRTMDAQSLTRAESIRQACNDWEAWERAVSGPDFALEGAELSTCERNAKSFGGKVVHLYVPLA